MPEPVVVIGIGGDGSASLNTQACQIIARADQIWGGERLLADWLTLPAEKVILRGDIPTLLSRLKDRSPGQRVVILASGDPSFFGIGATLLRILPKEEVIILPHPSSLQVAFARVRIPWGDAVFTSAHARPLDEVIGLAKRFPKVGILTDPQNTPATIAGSLLAASVPDCQAIVCENLELPQERIIETRLSRLPGQEFDPLNVVLLIHDRGWRPQPIPLVRRDEEYAHLRGMITKADHRLLSLGRLCLCEYDMVWDIGAGSGAMSIEMAEIAWRGKVFAIERSAESLGYIHQNIQRYGSGNVEVVPGIAPAALEALPLPDAVFIGGSGGNLEGILNVVKEKIKPGGRLVAHFTLLENLSLAMAWMRRQGWTYDLTQVSLAQRLLINGSTHLTPQNPLFILNTQIPAPPHPPMEDT